MAKARRVNLRSILANPDLRRELMVPTLQATQAREGIDTTKEQAVRAYYVVTEGERAAFFDLARFRGSKGIADRRQEQFCRALAENMDLIRFDVARRDFSAIEGRPLAYRRVGVIAHIFHDSPPLEPGWGIARQGKATANDSRWLRRQWEIVENVDWVPFAKGGAFSRFYYETDLVIDWREKYREDLRLSGNGLPSLDLYFKPGLTWPRRTQRGFNVRIMRGGCVFADKGPAIFPKDDAGRFYLLGVLNAAPTEYILQGLTSFGSWEVGAVRRLPIPEPSHLQRERISERAEEIFYSKAKWDRRNELSREFCAPWVLHADLTNLIVPARLDHLAEVEAKEETRIQLLYAELNDEVYRLYGIPDITRTLIEETLGERPPEILWPQMEGQTVEQKRMEHVFRLLSYAVKRVIESDGDGVVPFVSMVGEPSLLERVLGELHSFFPDRDIGRVEIEIVNELNKSVKGYQRTRSLAEWLENAFFKYHSALYKGRPILWHIASSQGISRFAFGALVHYHKFNRDRMAKLRSQYLREAIETFRREAALADKEGRGDDRVEWQARLEEAQQLDGRLQGIQEGAGDFAIQTPWKTLAERPLGWSPDIDDGVKVNIEPLQKAGVLRIAKVI
jgi:hypothetical protein